MKTLTNEEVRQDLLRAAKEIGKWGVFGGPLPTMGPRAFAWAPGHEPKVDAIPGESRLANKIRVFCVPEILEWQNGYRQVTSIVLSCPADTCKGELPLPSTAEFEHGRNCPLSKLGRLGDVEALRRSIARTAAALDYEGGGYHSCQICGGRTEWKGDRPACKKNCPGAEARGREARE